jgi:AAA15 family ATPase/GTPase
LFDIVKVLSSGTIKGINFLENTYSVLKNGGYLIIDEIENHMHKKLVQTIIRFFTDPD